LNKLIVFSEADDLYSIKVVKQLFIQSPIATEIISIKPNEVIRFLASAKPVLAVFIGASLFKAVFSHSGEPDLGVIFIVNHQKIMILPDLKVGDRLDAIHLTPHRAGAKVAMDYCRNLSNFNLTDVVVTARTIDAATGSLNRLSSMCGSSSPMLSNIRRWHLILRPIEE